MKRTTRRSRTNLAIPESVRLRLNLYALAAGAAGVSLLALAQPSEAEIVFTPTHVTIGSNGSYNLDLNNDGITDFTIAESFSHGSSTWDNALFVAKVPTGNGLIGVRTLGGWNLASALNRGAVIGSSKVFISSFGGLMALFGSGPGGTFTVGSWVNVTNKYLGLKFLVNGQTHFGWARLRVGVHKFNIPALLTGYAYETTPGRRIRAGQTSGTADDSAAGEEFTHPGTLGVLARGAAK